MLYATLGSANCSQIWRTHLGESSVIDTWFEEITVELSVSGYASEYAVELSLTLTSWMQNAGLDREGRRTVWLLNMIFTDDIVGLLAGFLCTHRSPTWIHFRIWSTGG
jgi:hypothetical protein